jgi:DNA-binding response OmpR family regulator
MSELTGSPSRRSEQPGGPRALVVDDECALAELVSTYLTRDGFEVSMAHDGAQAIEVAREVDPDVMVLDLGLPVLDGVEVCRQVRTFSDCYIVMLTARTEEIDVLETLSARPTLAFTRSQLIEAVWGLTWVGDEHLVDVHVAHLRRKLGDDPSAPRYVRTVRGIGYRMGDGA